MTAATRRRQQRVRKRTDPKPGKESWLIVGPDGELLRELTYGEGATLSVAQNIMKAYIEPGDEITVQWKALFGEPETLYRLVRGADGDLITFTA